MSLNWRWPARFRLQAFRDSKMPSSWVNERAGKLFQKFRAGQPFSGSCVWLANGKRKVFNRSNDAMIRVYDEAGNVIETHEHKGDFREWLFAKQKAAMQ